MAYDLELDNILDCSNKRQGINMRVSTTCLVCVIASLHGAMAATLLASLVSHSISVNFIFIHARRSDI